MSIDPDTFKSILSRWASGVTVVTCRRPEGGTGEAGGVHGMTASSFSSVSLEPPLVLVCVSRRNRTHALISEQRAFGLHILPECLHEVSSRCAGFRGEEGHWLEDLPHRREATGAPILDGALAWMDCALWQAYGGGDHTIFVGEIRSGGATADGGEPLLWFGRGYRSLGGPPGP